MPYNALTGAPEHPAIDQSILNDGLLLRQDHPSWGKIIGQAQPFIQNGDHLEPIQIHKIKKSEIQKASLINEFALYPTQKNLSREKVYVGAGTSGTVKFCQSKNKSWHLVKIINIGSCGYYNGEADPYREAYFLHHLGKLKAFYSCNKKLYLVQDWIEGETLFNACEQLMDRDIELRLKEITELLRAVLKLDEAGICHNDWVLKNIIRKSEGSYEIIDFGRATRIDKSNETSNLFGLYKIIAKANLLTLTELKILEQKIFPWDDPFEDGTRTGPDELGLAFESALTEIAKPRTTTQKPLLKQAPNLSQRDQEGESIGERVMNRHKKVKLTKMK